MTVKPAVPLLPKHGAADKVFLGTVVPPEADLEQAVMAYRAKLYEPWQGFPWSIFPRGMRGGTVKLAETALRIAVANGTDVLALAPNTQGLDTLHGTGVLPYQEDNLKVYGILPYSQYSLAVKSIRQHQKAHAQGQFLENPELEPLLENYDDRQHTPDFVGWLNYLAAIEPEFTNRLRAWRKPALFPAHPRKFHTHIAAPNGWGKSELLKALAFHDIQHDAGSLVVIEPIGRMVGQIARFPELAGGDRLVLLQPELTAGQYPCLNPLEVHGFNATQKASYAETLAGALALIADNPLTSNMTLVATACIRVLLDRPGSTLSDLVDMLDEPETARKGQPARPSLRTPLLRLGEAHRDPEVAKFFRYRFDASNLKTSKSGLSTRLISLLMLPGFRAMTCGPSTVQLEQLIDARKVILFNLSDMGDQARFAYGRLLLALIEDIGKRRVRADRADVVPVQVIVDEATMMMSPTMLTIINGLRKFGVHLTIVQQVAGQRLDADGKRVLATVGVKIAGADQHAELAAMFGEHAKGLEKPAREEFWVKWGEAAPVRLTVRSDLADDTHATPDAVWQGTLAAQAKYYRPFDPEEPLTLPEASEASTAFQSPAGGRGSRQEQWSRMPKNAAWQSLKVE